jgi:uncharacterized protein (TIGR02453 family)
MGLDSSIYRGGHVSTNLPAHRSDDMSQSYFSPQVFAFLRELEENNNRPWFEANKQRYIEVIRQPSKEFIEDFGPRLQAISEHFVADTRTNGGSPMRPYRDTRFSSDKTPYKTNVGVTTPTTGVLGPRLERFSLCVVSVAG